MSRHAVGVALVLAALMRASVQAQPAAGLQVQWDAPATCAKPAAFERSVLDLVGPSWRGGDADAYEVRVDIEQLDDGRWQLDLEVQGQQGGGERTLQMDSCAELQEAAALLVALAINPDAAVQPPSAEQVEEPEVVEAPPTLLTGGRLSALIAGDGGSLPGPALGAALAAGWANEHWLLQLGASAYLPRSSSSAGAEVSAWLAAGAANACYLPLRRSLSLGPCVGGEVGVIRARVQGVERPSSAAKLWAAVAPSILAELALSEHVALQLSAGAAFPLTRYGFKLRSGVGLHTPPAVTPRAAVGVVFGVP